MNRLSSSFVESLLDQASAFAPLSKAEISMLECAQSGEIAFCGPSHKDSDPGNDPAHGEKWAASREIRAKLIEWLWNTRSSYVHSRGVQVHGAKITGPFDLSFGSVSLHLMIVASYFTHDIDMRAISASEISFSGSRLKNLSLRRANIKGALFLNTGCYVEGCIDLTNAHIGEDLACDRGTFAGHSTQPVGERSPAINAPSITVGADVILTKFSALSVSFTNARIGGDFDASGGKVTSLRVATGSGETSCIDFRSAQVRRDVLMGDSFHSRGMLLFDGFSCGGSLNFANGSQLDSSYSGKLADSSEPGDWDSLSVVNARIDGDLTFDDQCVATGCLDMTGIRIGGDFEAIGTSFSCTKSTQREIAGDNVIISGNVRIERCKVLGFITMKDGQIGGDASFTGSSIRNLYPGTSNPAGTCLNLERSNIHGALNFSEQFQSIGPIFLSSAHIGGNLDFSDAKLVGRFPGRITNPFAVIAENVSVGGALLLWGKFSAVGVVSILGTTINGNLEAEGASLSNPFEIGFDNSGVALKAAYSVIKGGINLTGPFSAIGKVDFDGATIGGDVSCAAGYFSDGLSNLDPKTGAVLSFERAQVTGDMKFTESGSDKNGNPLPFIAHGEVDLDYLQCSGEVFFDGARCLNPLDKKLQWSGTAVTLFSAKIGRSIYFRDGFQARGTVHVANAQIGQNLGCRGGSFQTIQVVPEGKVPALSITMTTVGLALEVDRGCHIDGILDLSDTTTNEYADNPEMWPQKTQLLLDGFTYKKISASKVANPPKPSKLTRASANNPPDPIKYEEVSIDVDGKEGRLEWLRRQPPVPVPVRSYIQLAKMFTDLGDDESSQTVLKALGDEQHIHPTGDVVDKAEKLAGRVTLGATIGYGEKPLRSVAWLGLLSGLGWIIYRRSYIAGHMVPTEKDALKTFQETGEPPRDYDSFSPLVYSLENTVPLVKLGQSDKWRPASHKDSIFTPESPRPMPETPPQTPEEKTRFNYMRLVGLRKLDQLAGPPWVRYFLWIQILLGWILATLFVAGFSGLIKGK